MSKPRFIYLLQEADGRYRQIKNGVVTSLITPWALPHAPNGNQEISLGWQRSETYYGTIPSFSVELGFVLEGRKILKNDLYKYNIDRELWLVIKRLTYSSDPAVYNEVYKTWYSGQIDFSTAEDNHEDYQFKCNILDGGVRKLMTANEGTEYSIPLAGDAGVVYMDGSYINGDFKWFISRYETLASGYPSIIQLSNDNPIPGLALLDVQMNLVGGAPNANSLDYFAQLTQDIANVHLTGEINGLNPFGVSGPLSVTLYVFNMNTGTLRETIDLTPADPYPANYTLQIDQTLNLQKGDRLFLKSASSFNGEGSLRLRAKSKPLPSYVPGYTLYQLGRKLVEQITGDPDNFKSDFLQANQTTLITSGDGVRSLAGAGVKITWRDYWKIVNVYHMAECQITRTSVRIEERGVAYSQANSPVALGNVKKLKVAPAVDLMYTDIKVGHKEQKVDDTNGRFDFNGYEVFKTPINGIEARTLDLQAPCKASPYEIEQTRSNFENKTTTDKEEDNDLYAIAVIADDAHNISELVAVFHPGTYPILPGANGVRFPSVNPTYRIGQRLSISNTVSNNGQFTVKNVYLIPGQGQFVELVETVVAESTSPGFAHVEILSGKFYLLDRSITIEQLVATDDVDAETKASLFNVPLSPKRILQKHYRWLAGMCWHYGTGQLKFTSANRNSEMIAGGIVEKENVSVTALGLPMFQPFYLEFDTLAPQNIAEVLDADPFPVFRPTWEEVDYDGFLIRVGIAPNTEEEQTYKLLSTPDNDFEWLIDS